MSKSAPTFTSLGMHYVNVSATEVATVLVEVNVRGLLSLHVRRLCKSKRGLTTACSGTVRVSLASPADREVAHRVWLAEGVKESTLQRLFRDKESAEESLRFLNEHIDFVRDNLKTAGLSVNGEPLRHQEISTGDGDKI